MKSFSETHPRSPFVGRRQVVRTAHPHSGIRLHNGSPHSALRPRHQTRLPLRQGHQQTLPPRAAGQTASFVVG